MHFVGVDFAVVQISDRSCIENVTMCEYFPSGNVLNYWLLLNRPTNLVGCSIATTRYLDFLYESFGISRTRINMARKLLDTQSTAPSLALAPTAPSRALGRLSPDQVESRLRQKRSSTYIEAISKLDAGGHVQTRESISALLAAIESELPELSTDFWPAGYVAKCYLGKPYEVHSLDRAGSIISHYKAGQTLPNGMERARGLAEHGGYAFIEVYSDKLIAVAVNGDISLVKG